MIDPEKRLELLEELLDRIGAVIAADDCDAVNAWDTLVDVAALVFESGRPHPSDFAGRHGEPGDRLDPTGMQAYAQYRAACEGIRTNRRLEAAAEGACKAARNNNQKEN